MKYFSTRKFVSIVSIGVLAFTSIYCTVMNVDIPSSANMIVSSLIGFVGYYFGKSTALDGSEKAAKERIHKPGE